jgi:predicted  nucleic acid-binding Zn-ribbon protein
MTRSQQLYELQKVDLARDAHVAELAGVVQALRGDPAVAAAAAAVQSASEALGRIEPVLRDRNLERDSVKAHIAREEEKLYGGIVKSPKELQNLEMEIEALRRRLANLDDAVLETMLERDTAADALDAAKSTLAEAEEHAAKAHTDLLARKRELTVAVRQADQERTERTADISPADLELYTRIRASKHGRAVSRISDGTCGACGMQLPRQDRARVHDDAALVNCPGCGRILTE